MDKENFKHKLHWHFKHKRSNKRALQALKTIESYRGKINPKFYKLSDEYATEVLGNKMYAPWLYVNSALQNKFEEGWFPDDYYLREIVPKQKGDYGKISDRNFITSLLFPEVDKLDVAYFINGLFCSLENKILNHEDVKDYIFKKDSKLVYKLENSLQGKGVFVFDENNFDMTLCLSQKHSNGVFQKFIQQHPFFSDFTANSVATIRITTVSDKNGTVSVRGAYIRFARDKDTHVKSNSAVYVPIDLDTGELSPFGYLKNWLEIEAHPDSNISFRDKKIPHFKNCLAKAIQMHSNIPFMGCIGWDVVVDNFEKVQLIEWNGIHNGIFFHEATTGPCFKGLNWENAWKEK